MELIPQVQWSFRFRQKHSYFEHNCYDFDDAVAVKTGSTLHNHCTQNITVDGAKIYLGVGMSICSVSLGNGIVSEHRV